MLRFKIMSSHSTFCFPFISHHYYNIKLHAVKLISFVAYLETIPAAGTGGGSRSLDVLIAVFPVWSSVPPINVVNLVKCVSVEAIFIMEG